MINYTFIIPHKNIPDLLQRCLNSIPRSEDIQIIVVDDNSDPDKVDFEHFPGVGEPCVEVYFTKEGKGAGYARNVGLKHAKGKWLLFADADDLFSYKLNSILNLYVDKDVDVIFFNYDSVYSDDVSKKNEQKGYRKSILNYENLNLKYCEYYLRYVFGPPWCKMLSLNFVNLYNITFDECKKHNDTMFSLRVGYYARKVLIDKTIAYYNTYRINSITNISENICYRKMVQELLGVELRYMSFVKRNNIYMAKWRLHYYFETIIRKGELRKLILSLIFLRKSEFSGWFIFMLPKYLFHRFLIICGIVKCDLY